MKKLLSLLALFLICHATEAQPKYVKTYGKSTAQPVIFLHGGPGYNSVNFEVTTAQNLADKGYFVIVYDRRGEGRSEDKDAQFNFSESIDDINAIFAKYKVENAIVIGQSFGGILGVKYAAKYPGNVKALLLSGTPVSMQETFRTIIKSVHDIYETKNDSVSLKLLDNIAKMDTNSIEFSSNCFSHAMINGFYTPKNPSEEAYALYAKFRNDTVNIKYAYEFSYEAPQGFLQKEKYTSLDISEDLAKLVEQKVNVCGVYGKDDGLISPAQVEKLQSIIGKSHVKYFDSCSHNTFIDQQTQFFDALTAWTKKSE
jgi:proline iminopeptidase